LTSSFTTGSSGSSALLRNAKEREEPVVLALGDRVVLVGVALGAADRQPEPDGAGRRRPVGHGVEAELQRVDPPLLVEHRVAVEPGGDLLRRGGVRQQVPGELLDGEPVERHVGVERVDHPVAVRPDGARPVLLVAVGVGVPGQVEPPPRPPLAVVRRGEEPVHHLLVGVRRLVREEGIHLRRRRRQADQVEVHPPDERVPVRLGRWLQPLLLQPGEDERVDRVATEY
jgi:hypothetical protein